MQNRMVFFTWKFLRELERNIPGKYPGGSYGLWELGVGRVEGGMGRAGREGKLVLEI